MNIHNDLFSDYSSSVEEILVSGFLDHDLFELYETDPDDPQIAYDLIATWGRIKRCKTELVEKYLGDAARKLEEIIISDMERLLEMAVRVPDASAWLQYAEKVSTASENLMFRDPDVESHLYCDLLEQLDDAELVCWAASRREKDLPTIDLEPCFTHIQENIEKYINAAGWAHGIVQTTRTDLMESDPELALTLEKINWILKEFKEAESELRFAALDRLSEQELLDNLIQLCDEDSQENITASIRNKIMLLPETIRNRALWKPILPIAPDVLAAASSPKIGESELLTWEGDDGGWEAIARYELTKPDEILAIWIITDLPFTHAIIGKKRIPLEREEPYYVVRVNLRESLEETGADMPMLILETIDGDYSIGLMKR